jgi:hypothetical protein
MDGVVSLSRIRGRVTESRYLSLSRRDKQRADFSRLSAVACHHLQVVVSWDIKVSSSRASAGLLRKRRRFSRFLTWAKALPCARQAGLSRLHEKKLEDPTHHLKVVASNIRKPAEAVCGVRQIQTCWRFSVRGCLSQVAEWRGPKARRYPSLGQRPRSRPCFYVRRAESPRQ